MKRTLIAVAVLAVLMLLAGCDNSPKGLGKEFTKGKCIVCKRNTKVREIPINPLIKYSVKLCWRPECEQAFGSKRDQYVEKSKLPNPADVGLQTDGAPPLPGEAPVAMPPRY